MFGELYKWTVLSCSLVWFVLGLCVCVCKREREKYVLHFVVAFIFAEKCKVWRDI